MRVPRLAAPLAATVLLAGCGGGKASYPPQVKKGFLARCDLGKHRPQVCLCILSRLEDTVPYAEFKAADDALRTGGRAPAATAKKIAAATKRCA